MTKKVPIHFAFSHNLVSVRVSGNPCAGGVTDPCTRRLERLRELSRALSRALSAALTRARPPSDEPAAASFPESEAPSGR